MARQQSRKKRNERLKRVLWPWLQYLGISQRKDVTWCWVDTLGKAPWSTTEPVAKCTTNYPYGEIHLSLVGKEIDLLDDDELEEVLLHELMHGDVFAPIRTAVNNTKNKTLMTEVGTLEETAADLLKHWLIRLRNRGGKLPPSGGSLRTSRG